jgi:glycosyltransferase involved in cell wall biosynthesis
MEEVLRPLANVDFRSQKNPERLAVQLRTFFSGNTSRHSSELFLLTERIPLLFGRLPGSVALVPNQERFPARHLRRLKNVDVVLCKTRHAQQVFNSLSCTTEFIGFTSVDRKLPDGRPDFNRYFHLAGRSTLKGTSVVLEAWKRHPEWPRLTLVQSAHNAPDRVPDNVELITQFISDSDLQTLQNEHGVHLCPSLSEGWGHYIVEAMSCGALTITTDGPPMNELVTPDRGLLIPSDRSEPRHLGTNWIVSVADLEAVIQRSLALTDHEKQHLGNAAREWFVSNDREFRQRFADVVRTLTGH